MSFLGLYRGVVLACGLLMMPLAAAVCDLQQVKQAGVLRHLGVPYANFVSLQTTAQGSQPQGMDVELIRGFAEYLGVDYQYVASGWPTLVSDLVGDGVNSGCDGINGDVIANGLTILPSRAELLTFSNPYFPSAVWLVARSDAPIQPIAPSGDQQQDIDQVRALMSGISVLAMEHTCLDPGFNELHQTNATVVLPRTALQLNEMVPAILNSMAQTTILDVPDTIIALDKWPGEIKVIGPISLQQQMAAGFRQNTPQLTAAFNQYLQQLKTDGRYLQLVQKYYPSMFYTFPEFFDGIVQAQ
ncbi:transporter substrate-binding domain-containing protein [Ferrimonas senticii]|uniref:transporter substrate-binding domain-containing protein n=1 Tax=Ferrimonas senticii TaxID=394566 RepID=UPI000421D9B1|nr:transporter substrate-binding domain-containing protein [Ferrimonas senticii]